MSAPAVKSIRMMFGASQTQFAEMADTSQATVSRWEKGELFPDLQQLARIRAAAVERGIEWSDEWFFNASSLPGAAQ